MSNTKGAPLHSIFLHLPHHHPHQEREERRQGTHLLIHGDLFFDGEVSSNGYDGVDLHQDGVGNIHHGSLSHSG